MASKGLWEKIALNWRIFRGANKELAMGCIFISLDLIHGDSYFDLRSIGAKFKLQ